MKIKLKTDRHVYVDAGQVYIKDPCCASFVAAATSGALRFFKTSQDTIITYVALPVPKPADKDNMAITYCPWCGARLD